MAASSMFTDLGVPDMQELAVPDSGEEFLQFVKRHFALVHPPLPDGDGFSCVICASEAKTRPDCSIARKCAASRYPCDGGQCTCKHQSMCFECLVSNLFTSTSPVLKSQKRFRAKCPFCKASYCHLDLVYYTDNAAPASKPASKPRSRRRAR